jgi:hypothetical protein
VVPQATTTPPQKNAPAKEASSAPPAAAAPAAAAPAPKPAPKAPEDTSTAKEPDAPSAPAVVAAPAEPEAGPGEMSDFQKAMLELEKVGYESRRVEMGVAIHLKRISLAAPGFSTSVSNQPHLHGFFATHTQIYIYIYRERERERERES